MADDDTTTATTETAPPAEPPAKTFTQDDVNKIIDDRLKREREKFADYDDLKKKAGAAATDADRIAALEQDLNATRTDALRRRIQATHKISDEDAALFMTGTDEDSLTAQAKRLAERASEEEAAGVARKKQGNKVPGEGSNPKPGEDELVTFARNLFAAGN
ncbi:MAG: hypothetical protein ABIP03_03560 [Aquihabitans sp.]